MSSDDRPITLIKPRPGLVKALGGMNITLSILLSTCLTLPAFWLVIAGDMSQSGSTPAAPTLSFTVGSAPGPPPPGPTISVRPAETGTPPAQAPKQSIAGAIHSVTVKDVPLLVKYAVIDLSTASVLNLAMFVSGIGLVKLKGWGARSSDWVAWAKIARLVLLAGGFVVVIAPLLSQAFADKVVAAIVAAKAVGPDVASMRAAYWMTLVVAAVVMAALGLIYPAMMLWVARRPGFRDALVSRAPMVEARQS